MTIDEEVERIESLFGEDGPKFEKGPDAILGFQGEFAFLSNFEFCLIELDAQEYRSVEAAFQAAKIEDPKGRSIFHQAGPADAKKFGRLIKLRKDWEMIKTFVMYSLVSQKFSRYPDLAEKLKATGNRYLEETNWWGDQYWGALINGQGQNRLGIILMDVRSKL